MSTMPVFSFGETASASQFMSALTQLQSSGQDIINLLNSYRNSALINFSHQVETLDSRTSVTNRLLGPTTLVNFVTSDFLDIDQINTSATVNANSGTVSLHENPQPEGVGELSIVFSPSAGTAQSISSVYTIYTVTSPNVIPTGNFIITLNEIINLNTLNFELTAITSNPTISISYSLDGVTYTPVNSYSLNGYNLTTNFTTSQIKYISLSITPTIPDDLSGNQYTFGIISVNGYVTKYEYSSTFTTKPITFSPTSSSVQFTASGSAENLYYLNFSSNSDTWYEVKSGDIISIPGINDVSTTETAITPSISNYIPIINTSNNIIYEKSWSITDNNNNIPVILGLKPSDPNIIYLENRYISVILDNSTSSNIYTLFYTNNTDSSSHTFNLNYSTGPSSIDVILKTILTTTDNTVTPVFNGAELNEV